MFFSTKIFFGHRGGSDPMWNFPHFFLRVPLRIKELMDFLMITQFNLYPNYSPLILTQFSIRFFSLLVTHVWYKQNIWKGKSISQFSFETFAWWHSNILRVINHEIWHGSVNIALHFSINNKENASVVPNIPNPIQLQYGGGPNSWYWQPICMLISWSVSSKNQTHVVPHSHH